MKPILLTLLSIIPFLGSFAQETGSKSIIEKVDSIIMDDNSVSLAYEDGSYYFGQMTDSVRNGYGAMVYPDGTIYKGEWQNDLWHGKGYISYPDGDTYLGEFRYNVMEGEGIYHYSDSSYYEGQWENNMYNGQGTFHYSDGGTYTGSWKDDHRQGLGLLISMDDHKIYSGYFYHDDYIGTDAKAFEALEKLGNGNRVIEKLEIQEAIKPSPELLLELSYSSKFMIGVEWGGLISNSYWGLSMNLPTYQPFTGNGVQATDFYGESWTTVGWDDYTADERTEGTYTALVTDFNYGHEIKDKLILGAGFGFALDYKYKNCICSPQYGCPIFSEGEQYYKQQFDRARFDLRLFMKYRKELSHSTYAVGGLALSKEAGLTFSLGLAF